MHIRQGTFWNGFPKYNKGKRIKKWICLQAEPARPTLLLPVVSNDSVRLETPPMPNNPFAQPPSRNRIHARRRWRRTIRVCRTIVITSLFPNKPPTFHLHYLDSSSLLLPSSFVYCFLLWPPIPGPSKLDSPSPLTTAAAAAQKSPGLFFCIQFLV